MTNEQQKAKELAELLTAFADGKQFEWWNSLDKRWSILPVKFVSTLTEICEKVRIKPETKRVPLTMQDLIDRELRKDTMVVIRENRCCLITDYQSDCFWFGTEVMGYDELIGLTFIDNSPCYKEVECE